MSVPEHGTFQGPGATHTPVKHIFSTFQTSVLRRVSCGQRGRTTICERAQRIRESACMRGIANRPAGHDCSNKVEVPLADTYVPEAAGGILNNCLAVSMPKTFSPSVLPAPAPVP